MLITSWCLIEGAAHGVASGQTIDNSFFYRAPEFAGERDLADWLENFAIAWRNVLALVTTEYAVVEYEARILHNMLWLEEPAPPLLPSRPAMRYRELVTRAPEVADAGQDDPPSHPTQTAVSISKQCGQTVTWADDVVLGGDPEVVPGEKLVRGSCRVSSIAEDKSKAASQNEWEGAFVTAFQTAIEEMLMVQTQGTAIECNMVVLSEFKDKAHRVHELSGLPTLLVAPVLTLSVDPIVKSQNSRKQKGSA